MSQRAPEIALRMAIGATQRDVQGMVLRQAAGLGIAGAAAGLRLAGDMISEVTLAMVAGVGLKTLAETIHPIPPRPRS